MSVCAEKKKNLVVGPCYNDLSDLLPTMSKKLNCSIINHIKCQHGKIQPNNKKIINVPIEIYQKLSKHFYDPTDNTVIIDGEKRIESKKNESKRIMFVGKKDQYVCQLCRVGKQDSKNELAAKKK